MWEVICGEARKVMQDMSDERFQTVITSPPYWGLRDYRIEGQLGLEPTPEEYVDRLVEIFREVRRVLRDDGTVWLVLGDSYWGGKGKSGYELPHKAQERLNRGETLQHSYQVPGYMEMRPADGKHPVIKPKDLVGIPWLVAFALRADGWWLRMDNIWSKPNPMPESVKDRTTKAHEYVFLLSKSERYFYDADAIAEPITTDPSEDYPARAKITGRGKQGASAARGRDRDKSGGFPLKRSGNRERKESLQPGHQNVSSSVPWEGDTRNKRSVWTVAAKPYPEAHFAVYPTKLIEPCVLAGSAAGDTILDPFVGSGTTGVVALRHGRNFVGIDLSPEYCEMARNRIDSDCPIFNRGGD